jgi:hypothetical protein
MSGEELGKRILQDRNVLVRKVGWLALDVLRKVSQGHISGKDLFVRRLG